MGVSCLPWYGLRETRRHASQLWFCLAEHLIADGFESVPHRLLCEADREELVEHPDLLLAQTCGYAVATDTEDLVRVVAAPCHSAPGCEGASYRSFVVVRKDLAVRDLEDTRGLRCAVDEPWSQAGAHALRALVAPLQEGGRFFGAAHRSGSHAASLGFLQDGLADVACIDCVTLELVRQHRPHLLEGVRILCSTAAVPTPPFITAARTRSDLVPVLYRALREVLSDPRNEAACEALLIAGIAQVPLDAYRRMAVATQRARSWGYAEQTW